MASVQTETSLETGVVGNTVQVCVVSRDLPRTAEGMIRVGIGPWRVFTNSPETVGDMTYKYSGSMMWEIIQPLEGPRI